MAKLNIGLPDDMKQFVDDRTRTGQFASEDAYVQDLIKQDQERQQKIADIQKIVEEAISSGESDESMRDILRSMKEKRSKTA
ncbi:type II toxin-antitoxin system ParD family antitoxin [Ciceribacter sp. L1K23]|uniref:ribbon-helix-helix domain-containing protein n=1 Tax=Ciceribacter sp. L1K23 TaxID=2820276 RepID=UPI001B834429|nr:type II toxin-antitoxin system ParD family antitoxin [Ciceribacter sp. L1K23]MBR0555627.1 type II toxin-antitoxin system ParD family antitoxin [Ciceribacter sp. L1K23]